MITCIFFFGGYRASIHDMAKWQGSAADQTSDDVYVFTYAWPMWFAEFRLGMVRDAAATTAAIGREPVPLAAGQDAR